MLCTLGEAPLWSARERALWFVDLRSCALHRLEIASGAHRHWAFPEFVAGIVLAPAAGWCSRSLRAS